MLDHDKKENKFKVFVLGLMSFGVVVVALRATWMIVKAGVYGPLESMILCFVGMVVITLLKE